MTISIRDYFDLPFDQRYDLLKRCYLDNIDNTQSIVDALAFHVDNMLGHSMTLCGLALIRPGHAITLRDVHKFDIFLCLCIIAEIAHELLHNYDDNRWEVSIAKRIMVRQWELLEVLRSCKNEDKDISTCVFLFGAANLIVKCSLHEDESDIGSLPPLLLDWYRFRNPPLLQERMTIIENADNVVSNLETMLHEWTAQKRGRD